MIKRFCDVCKSEIGPTENARISFSSSTLGLSKSFEVCMMCYPNVQDLFSERLEKIKENKASNITD